MPEPSESSEFESFADQLRREHPWIMRRARWRGAYRALIGKYAPWLCRHTASFGPAGGDVGLCLDCGEELDWAEDDDD